MDINLISHGGFLMYMYNPYDNSYVRVIPTNGTRIQQPHKPEIYLVDKGKRRRIVDADTYLGIFKDWKGIKAWDLQAIPEGPPIVRGTFLFKYRDSPNIYLHDLEDGHRWVKRLIKSWNTFKFFHFDMNKVVEYASHSFNPPNGSDIVAIREPLRF
jgi:hypothetical protein